MDDIKKSTPYKPQETKYNVWDVQNNSLVSTCLPKASGSQPVPPGHVLVTKIIDGVPVAKAMLLNREIVNENKEGANRKKRSKPRKSASLRAKIRLFHAAKNRAKENNTSFKKERKNLRMEAIQIQGKDSKHFSLDTIDEEYKRAISCHLCGDIIMQGGRQCENRHALCGNCYAYSEKKECPYCRGDPIATRKFEILSKHATFNCMMPGCDAKGLTQSQYAEHQKACLFDDDVRYWLERGGQRPSPPPSPPPVMQDIDWVGPTNGVALIDITSDDGNVVIYEPTAEDDVYIIETFPLLD